MFTVVVNPLDTAWAGVRVGVSPVMSAAPIICACPVLYPARLVATVTVEVSPGLSPRTVMGRVVPVGVPIHTVPKVAIAL